MTSLPGGEEIGRAGFIFIQGEGGTKYYLKRGVGAKLSLPTVGGRERICGGRIKGMGGERLFGKKHVLI